MADLVVQDLHVNVAGKEILKGLNLTVKAGQVHAIMGPNGAGKTTLSMSLAGHPRYEVTGGQVTIGDKDLLDLEVDERAREGLFLAFQYPSEIPGVPVKNFLRQSYNAVKGTDVDVFEFYSILTEKLELMKMDPSFMTRHLNEGFSGGEKKRHEILQMALLEPKIAILDETDSGLDIDALKIVADGVNSLRGPELGVLVITHYHRLLEYIKPDVVHVMMDGRIVKSGGPELALELEAKGYDWVREQFSIGGEV